MKIWTVLIRDKLEKFCKEPINPISALYFYQAFVMCAVHLKINRKIVETREKLLSLYFVGKISNETIKKIILKDEKTVINDYMSSIPQNEKLYFMDGDYDIKERIPHALGYEVYRPE